MSDMDTRKEYYPVPIRQIRKKEYPLLEKTTYLDHAGTTPPPRSLMKEFYRFSKTNLLGNPHSESPSSSLSTHVIETARQRMLDFFRADPEHFDLIFVANATAAIKLVAEGIREQPFWYGYHADAHTSLVGLRELSSVGSRCFFSDIEVDEWIRDGAGFSDKDNRTASSEAAGLFAYPAQSNMNGRRLPLDWPAQLRKLAKQRGRNMYTLLDAAAYVTTAQLNLSNPTTAPDFTALSFYKIFGFPDLGGLIVRKDAGDVLLRRPYFGGGTVDMVVNGEGKAWHATKQGALHEALEDGTPAFHSVAALHCALDVHTRLYGSMDNVSKHAGSLAAAMLAQIASLTHTNGRSLCTIYRANTSDYQDRESQGPTIAFNLRDSQGRWIGKSNLERLAISKNIQLRTGGVCNPGGIASYLNMSPEEMRENYAEGLRCGNSIDELNGKPTGIVRISFGAMSNTKDVEHFVSFLKSFIDQEALRIVLPQTNGISTRPNDCQKEVQTFSKALAEKGIDHKQTNSTRRQGKTNKIIGTLRQLYCH